MARDPDAELEELLVRFLARVEAGGEPREALASLAEAAPDAFDELLGMLAVLDAHGLLRTCTEGESPIARELDRSRERKPPLA